MSPALARQVAVELTVHDALEAHARIKLGLEADRRTSPGHTAWASMVAFPAGAMIPLFCIVASPPAARLPATVVAVLVALLITGDPSSHLGEAPARPAMVRNLFVGSLAMSVTYAVGTSSVRSSLSGPGGAAPSEVG